MTESLFTSQTPVQNDQNDGTPTITRGVTLAFSVAGTITHVRWWCPVTNTGTYTVAVWELTSSSTGTLLQSKVHVGTPTVNSWNTTALDTPITIDTAKAYRIGVNNSQGRYVATVNSFISPLVNGHITAEAQGQPMGGFVINQGVFNISGALAFPNSGTANNYFVDVLFEPTGGVTTVTSDMDVRYRVYQAVVSDMDIRYAVAGIVTSDMDLRYRVLGNVIAPVVSQTYLAWQRAMTAALIADDPTTASLTPYSRVTTPAGGFTEVVGVVRNPQTFKLSELNFDQRATVTIAGVERMIDYHLIGPWDMLIAVGDRWTDASGTKFEVVGFSEGWDYMVKAFVIRHVPRVVNP